MSVISIQTAGSRASADACPLCERHGATQHKTTPRSQPRTDALLWTIMLTAALVVAAVGLGAERWFGIGATSGILAGAICAWFTFRERRRAKRDAHGAELKALAEDSDQRVAMVIKQFEWAVNDVAKIKADLERAQSASEVLDRRARERERYVQRLERQLFETRDRLADLVESNPAPDAAPAEPMGHVPFSWSLHAAGTTSVLELQLGATVHRPTRVRILDRDGQIVAVSAPPTFKEDGAMEFAIEAPPPELVAALAAGHDLNHAVEALTQYDWKPVTLEDSGRRTRTVSDKQGRYYRIDDSADAEQLLN